MLFRRLVLTLCLVLFCLGAVVGCAPPASTAQPSASYAACSPAVTVAPSEVPTFDEQAPPSTTTPTGEVPDLGI